MAGFWGVSRTVSGACYEGDKLFGINSSAKDDADRHL